MIRDGKMTDTFDSSEIGLKTGVVMDPISGISSYKDSTFAMLLEAQRRGHEIWYMEPSDLTIRDGVALGNMRPLSVRDNNDD